ncbi:MAG: hypothetical protein ABR526_13725 [Chthoniobacterales bacterium]
MAAWFVAADHCALASALQKPVTSSAPHAHCPGHPVPAKKGSSENLPCCKSLTALSAAPAKNVVGHDSTVFGSREYDAIAILLALWTSNAPVATLDTGPPHGAAYAESERSVLAHAPPFSLS